MGPDTEIVGSETDGRFLRLSPRCPSCDTHYDSSVRYALQFKHSHGSTIINHLQRCMPKDKVNHNLSLTDSLANSNLGPLTCTEMPVFDGNARTNHDRY